MEKIFPPEIGWSYRVHLAVIVIVFAAVMLFIGRESIIILIPVVILFLIIVAYFILIAARTRYTLDDSKLTIRHITSKEEIPYDSIRKIIGDTKNPINYGITVLSMDRIEIFYGNSGHVLISPQEKEEFISILRSKCSGASYSQT